MYGRNEFDFNLDDPGYEEADKREALILEIFDEVYDDIKRLGVMGKIRRVFTDYPRFSSESGTILEEMTEWSIDYKDHQNNELLDAVFNESKREQLIVEFCQAYAEKTVGKDIF